MALETHLSSPETLKLLKGVYAQVCEEFSIIDGDRQNGIAQEIVGASMDGVTDPDLLEAAAIAWLRRNLSASPKEGWR